MGGRLAYKWGFVKRGYNKLIEVILDRNQLEVITDSGGNDELTKLGGREVFIGGDARRNVRCISGSVVVSGYARRQRIPRQK